LVALALLLLVLGLFLYVSTINRTYFQIERAGYAELANGWGVDQYWPGMQSEVQYCVVDMAPAGFLFTGPTMQEFRIIDRKQREHCPTGSTVINRNADDSSSENPNAALMAQALELIYRDKNYLEAIRVLERILEEEPHHFGALWQRAEALERSGQRDFAAIAWKGVLAEAERNGYAEESEARARLENLD
jgi:tetratricopeptide (TPR) repeat protein